MGYNIQNYWVFRLCPSSGILETGKHDVSETDPVCAVVRKRVHELARAFYLLVTTIWRCSINRVNNPNPRL
jgi:hypothetical protein